MRIGIASSAPRPVWTIINIGIFGYMLKEFAIAEEFVRAILGVHDNVQVALSCGVKACKSKAQAE